MFEISEATLEAAFHRARLEPRQKGAVLFGVRGATPVGARPGRLAGSHQLTLATPDHLRPRCTLGYWRPGSGLAVFAGSTVPSQRYIARALAQRGETANQLCLGLHRGYRKGAHRSTKARYSHRALRMDRAIPVLRTADDLDYDGDDRLEYETALDNIHCAWTPDAQSVGFSSAGCQVIVGSANPETGPWSEFAALVYGDAQLEFDYALFAGGELRRSAAGAGENLPLALRYGSSGEEVQAVQEALTARGFSTAGVDGDFGFRTLLAVVQFQRSAMSQRAPDGVVGVQTLTALGLETLTETRSNASAPRRDRGPSGSPIGFTFRTESSDGGRFVHHYAAADGHDLYLGYATRPRGPLKVGLAQSSRRLKPVGARFFSPDDHVADHGVWAHLVSPTATVESGRCFECVNTYDRAAFTFGLLQFAAHIPDDNLILLFRDLLGRPEAPAYFPDLVLKSTLRGLRVHQRRGGEDFDLEIPEPRGGGSHELNLKRFMAYLNPSLEAVESEELSAAARLMHWTRTSKDCRALQVAHAVRALKDRMGHVRTALAGRPVDQCLAAADIRFQGRGGPEAIRRALQTGRPMDALLQIGAANHPARVKRLGAELEQLMQRPEVRRLRFDPSTPDLFS